MMQRIMSKEPVVIPDGNGGVRERFYVEVPRRRTRRRERCPLRMRRLKFLIARSRRQWRDTPRRICNLRGICFFSGQLKRRMLSRQLTADFWYTIHVL